MNLIPINEMNKMEIIFLSVIDYETYISEEKIAEFRTSLDKLSVEQEKK
jgi:hypothetical protein